MSKWIHTASLPDHTNRAPVTVKGRDAWALRLLVQRGSRGCTPITGPTGPRWSCYIYRLRQAGLPIDSIHESHTGDFPGRHVRYVLTERVVLARMEEN